MASLSVEPHTQRPDTPLPSQTPTPELSRAERLHQLERIISSSHFRNSKRYPSFLRYVVERTVEEDDEVLKERNLGIEIFGRPSDYDTNADPIVRVTAGEVRKRIAQYYQTPGHEHELRIDLPLGSYVPHFYPAHRAAVAPEHAAEPSALTATTSELQLPASPDVPATPAPNRQSFVGLHSRRWLVAFCVVLSLVAILAGAYGLSNVLRARSQEAGIQFFWQWFTPPSRNALIIIGVHFTDSAGQPISIDSHSAMTRNNQQSALSSMVDSDMVPVSDIVSYSKLTDLLTRRSLPYTTIGSADATLEELRNGPVLLIGGFDNVWTMRLISTLRYRFVPQATEINGIVDSKNPGTIWLFDNLQPAFNNKPDYAIVASYYDTTIEQHVVIAAGIGKNGTVAAAEFLSTNKYMENWLADAKVPANKNVELVLSTDVLDGEPGPPHVVASTTW